MIRRFGDPDPGLFGVLGLADRASTAGGDGGGDGGACATRARTPSGDIVDDVPDLRSGNWFRCGFGALDPFQGAGDHQGTRAWYERLEVRLPDCEAGWTQDLEQAAEGDRNGGRRTATSKDKTFELSHPKHGVGGMCKKPKDVAKVSDVYFVRLALVSAKIQY